MKNEKSTDAIMADFIKGERRGRIFSRVVSAFVPLAVLLVTFAAMNNISNRYSLAKQEILFELGAKEGELQNKEKEIQKLKAVLQDSPKLVDQNSAQQPAKNDANVQKMTEEFKHLQKPHKKLK